MVAGQAVVQLVDPASLWVKVRFDQGRSAGLAAGLPAEIALRSNPAQPLPGRVARVEAVSDSVTEERLAQVAFDRLPAGVSMGELAEVTVSLPATAERLVVPNASMQRQAGQIGVWLADGSALRFAPVRVGQAGLDGRVQVLDGLQPGDPVVVYSEKELGADSRVKVVEQPRRAPAMISLAGRDILHSWSKFVLTGVGLGLLIGVTLTMAGVYRGMVDDARMLLANSRADLWVVQQDTQGPYAEVVEPARRRRALHPGPARAWRSAANVTYLTMQVRRGETRRARHGGGLRARPARRAGLPGRRPPRHAQPLRSGGRRGAPVSSSASASASGATTTPWSA